MAGNKQKDSLSPNAPAARGFLLMLTHYDPRWVLQKECEPSFDMDVARAMVEELAAQKFNLLLLNVSDSVLYKRHPEFARSYSVPMKQVAALAAYARRLGLEVVPKLNFSRSPINCHNHWMRAPGEAWHTHFEDEYYWKTAFDCIDEVMAACRPQRFFHVGMDEDHERSCAQYREALRVLRTGLKKRGLRMVSWSDSGLDYASGQAYREKSEQAEQHLPRDCVRLLWNYWRVPAREMRGVVKNGAELWGAPGTSIPHLRAFRKALLAAGGNGMVLTRWIACQPCNRDELLGLIRTLGPIYRGE